MAGPWRDILNEVENSYAEAVALAPDEPSSPDAWGEIDKLSRWTAQVREGEVFRDWLGWTYIAWRRLDRWHRYQARVERTLLALVCDRYGLHDPSPDYGTLHNVSVGNFLSHPAMFPFSRDFPGDMIRRIDKDGLGAFLYTDLPAAEPINWISGSEVLQAARIKESKVSERFPEFPVIAVPRLTIMRLRSVSATPTATSGGGIGPQITLQTGQKVYGQSPAGILTPGSITMFVERQGMAGTCILGSRHVFGTTGSTVLDSAQNIIGQVVDDDPQLDASVVKIDEPWSIDYQLPGLNIIPGVPIFTYSQMPVQMFGANSGHQTGFVNQSYYVAPYRPGSTLMNSVLVNVSGQPGDSGGLLCSGYYAQPAIPAPYLAVTPPNLQDAYRCASVGVLHGKTSQGVGPASMQPLLFTPMQDICAGMNLDPLTR